MTAIRHLTLSEDDNLVVYAVNKPYSPTDSYNTESFPEDGDLLRLAQAHQGWIAIDYVGDGEDDELIFRQLGRMASALADLMPPSLIYTPTYQRLFVWDGSRRELLRGAEPREVFGPRPWVAADHTIFNVASDDAAMERAIQPAQKRLSEFLEAFTRPTKADHFLLKARFECGEHVEHLRLSPTKLGDGVIHGKLECEPHHIAGLKMGSAVTVAHEDVSDWAMKVADREPVGMFTEAVVRAAPRAAERQPTVPAFIRLHGPQTALVRLTHPLWVVSKIPPVDLTTTSQSATPFPILWRIDMSRLAAVTTILLVAGIATAADPIILDSFDDVNHRLTSNQQDRVQIEQLPAAEVPFGVNGARFRWTFPAANTWILNHGVTRSHETPLDLSEADALTVGFRVAHPNRALAIAFHLVDTTGAQIRFVDYPTFETTLTNWETRRYPIADFEKSRWHANGRAVNLAAINEVVYRLLNDAAVEPGSFTFDMSRTEATRNTAMLHHLMLEDFEQGVGNWNDPAGGQPREAASRDGTALALTTSGTAPTRYLRRLARPLDLRTARYARVALKGDPALNGANPIAAIILEDAAGNRAHGRIEQWAGRDGWAEMHLPFRADAIEHFTADSPTALSLSGASCWREEYRPGPRHAERTNLANITAIGLSIETATGAPGTILVDDLRIGFYSGADVTTAERDLRAAASPTPLAVRWQAAAVPLTTQIREAGKPALLYVRQPTNNRCRELETTLLVSQGFVFRTDGFLTFFEDTSRSQAIAREQNILRVPTIILFDREGNERSRFEVDIDDLTLYRAMDALR